MSDFEFLFILYSLVLGLSMVELLSGLGRSIERYLAARAGGPAFHMGWLTPLLAVFVMLDLLSFWGAAWTVRELVGVTGLSMLGTISFASLYYLTARLVFPSEAMPIADLDEHYFRIKRLLFGLLLALLVMQLGFYFSLPELRPALLAPARLGLTLVLVAMMIGAMLARSRRISLGLLIALILRYLLVYVT
jgi:hypothetical protein